MHKDDYLLDMVVELGHTTAGQVAMARTEAKPGQSVMNRLVEKGIITNVDIVNIKASHFGAEVIELRKLAISHEAISLIKSARAWCYRIIPIGETDGRVMIAMTDPSDLDTIDSLPHLLHVDITIYVVPEDDMEEALKKYYPGGEEEGAKLRKKLDDERVDQVLQ